MNTLEQQIEEILENFETTSFWDKRNPYSTIAGAWKKLTEELTTLIKQRERDAVEGLLNFAFDKTGLPRTSGWGEYLEWRVAPTFTLLLEQYLKEREQEVTDNGGEE